MDRLQVSVTCLLLKMTFDPITAQLLRPSGCPTCPEGYFVMKNCSVNEVKSEGIQCKLCTDCSAADQDTLVQCSTFADSKCGNKVTPAAVPATPPEPPASAPEAWIILTVILVSLFLVLLLGLFLTLLSCRKKHQRNNLKGLDPL